VWDAAAVGAALEAALQALETYIISLVKQALAVALKPFQDAINSFAESVLGAVDPSGPQAVWSSLSGTLFLFGVTIAVIVQVVLGIITGITLGAATIAKQLIVSLLITFVITAILYTLPHLTSPGAAMVNACETYSANFISPSGQQASWTSWANAFAYWETGISDAYAFSALKDAWMTAESPVWVFAAQATSFAFALLGTAFTVFANYENGNHDPTDGQGASDAALILAGVSLVFEFIALKQPYKTKSDKTLDVVIFALDLSTFGIAGAELSAGY
jgi:hypothetical protein